MNGACLRGEQGFLGDCWPCGAEFCDCWRLGFNSVGFGWTWIVGATLTGTGTIVFFVMSLPLRFSLIFSSEIGLSFIGSSLVKSCGFGACGFYC